MAPDPTLTFTVPSIYDGTTLDCRIFHPASLAPDPRAPPWRRHAAVMAHPYAPLGGCYDDLVLEEVVHQLLRSGYLVATFNFRGAGSSAGRTSWTAKPERHDYASVVGFLVYYLHYLDPFRDCPPPGESTPPSVVPGDAGSDRLESPVLILGGYSYGAMITTQLPPLPDLLGPFKSPVADSDAAQIRLRAESLAAQQNLTLGERRSEMLHHQRQNKSPKRVSVRVGGDEGSGSPRKSHDTGCRKSFSAETEEKLKKRVNGLLGRTKSGRGSEQSLDSTSAPASAPKPPPALGKLPVLAGLSLPRPAYLLISPLQGLISRLATVSLLPSSPARPRDTREEAAEGKLVEHPTLAVFGDRDGFVAASKLRAWVSRLETRPSSQFRGREIITAGHFWIEEGVMYRMREAVAEFSAGLLDDG